MIDTKLIIAIVVGVWALLFVIMMSIQKKRKSKATDYRASNADKALLHLYGKKFSIDGRDLALFETVSGENLEKIVALPQNCGCLSEHGSQRFGTEHQPREREGGV